MLRRADRYADHAFAYPLPATVGRAAAGAEDACGSRCTQRSEFPVALRLDAGDTLQDPLEEQRVICRAWRKTRLERRIIHRETLAGTDQRIVIQPGRPVRLQCLGQARDFPG